MSVELFEDWSAYQTQDGRTPAATAAGSSPAASAELAAANVDTAASFRFDAVGNIMAGSAVTLGDLGEGGAGAEGSSPAAGEEGEAAAPAAEAAAPAADAPAPAPAPAAAEKTEEAAAPASEEGAAPAAAGEAAPAEEAAAEGGAAAAPAAPRPLVHRGFCFAEYTDHAAASKALKALADMVAHNTTLPVADGLTLKVDWAEPLHDVDESIMALVRVLYVSNLPPLPEGSEANLMVSWGRASNTPLLALPCPAPFNATAAAACLLPSPRCPSPLSPLPLCRPTSRASASWTR